MKSYELLAYFVDPAAMQRLNRIHAASRAVIVFSSTWRNGYSVYKLNRDFREHLGCKARFIGTTPDLGRGPRGGEIQRWLDVYGPVQSFVILDDGGDMGDLLPRLVQTDPHVGLTDGDVERAIALLTGG